MKRITRFILAFLALSVGSALYAQNSGKISGTIRDKAKGEALPGANVTIKGSRLGAATDAEGFYFILNVPPGSYDVTASLVGYQTVTQQKVIVNIDKTTTLDFNLQESAVEADEVIITAERPDVAREKTTTSDVWRGDEVITRAGIREISQVVALSSDVSGEHFRGGREGEELYLLQGMGIINPLDQSTSFAPIMSAVEEVEVITSGFGAQYGNAQSGVVNISMREGRSDKWSARFETRGRIPGRKHFGPSVWDPNGQPYLQILDSWEKWKANNPNSTNPAPFFSTLGNGFDSRYGRDTTTLAQIAYTLYRLQAKRQYGQSYDNLLDVEGELTLSGPLSDDVRLFVAGRADYDWAFLPTEEPNKKRTVMGNLVFDVAKNTSLRLSGAYTNDQDNVFRSTRTNGFYSWTWDQALALGRRKTNNMQVGMRATYAPSSATFYELKVNALRTNQVDGSPAIDPNGYSGDAIWSVYSSSSAPDNFLYGNLYDTFRDEKTQTISIDGSVTSQVTPAHLVNAGVQSNFYSVDADNKRSVKSASGAKTEQYSAKPFELGAYISDKMEFEGMIANLGLRLDLWDQNVKYYADQYSPFRAITSAGDTIIDMTAALREETKPLARLQPRLGISFPVSLSTVFHVNYGTYVQRPPLNQTVFQQMPRSGFAQMILGNPRLRPQVTNSYDIGVMQGIAEGFTLDVSGYYKDVKDLIQQAFFFDKGGNYYSSFANRDYADIRGFKIGLAKRRGMLTGSLNYTYGVATGKNSTPFNESPKFFENDPSLNKLPSPKDVLLDFDRSHNLVLSAVVTLGEEEGPSFEGFYPFEEMKIAVSSFARSGRPYTYDDQGLGLLYNRRTPNEYSTTVRVTKDFPKLIGSKLSLYFEVENLFNQRILSYQAVFANARDNSSGSITENRNIEKYVADPGSIRYTEDINHLGFLIDQSFLIYENMPRSFTVGLVINL
ncbi:MAG: carboxypeptidase-like regulatory domain-containing protein [Ignavibacteriae bacterium]|nr:carboxypeptidase-like regulatory domain-containing protein [Ignavibacteriota bacterium]